MPNPPAKSAHDLVRAILKLHPDTRVNAGAKLAEEWHQWRVAVADVAKKKSSWKKSRPGNTTDRVEDITDPVRDVRNSEEPE